jgi:uncharacterized protein (TIGR02466 family)
MYNLDSGSKELKIDAWFPTLIGVSFNKDHKKDSQDIIKQLDKVKGSCLASIGQPSFFLHPCHKDKKLKKLNTWIQNRVDEYTKFYGFSRKMKPVESWFHWYKKNNLSDAHVHLGRTISIVYYLQSDPNDSRVIFHSPVPVDMKNPFDITANDSKEYLQKDHSFTECFYKPIEGMLLIFRSFVLHKVELKNNDLKDRIIISWDLD